MEIAIKIIIGIVALFHIYVMWLEIFAWTTRGPKTFKNFEKELFPKTKSLAANQGLYNGFLAAGLIWTFFICNPETRFQVSMFFLICVAIAGIYGAFTADKKIFLVQALPALVGIALLFLSSRKYDESISKDSQPIILERNEDDDNLVYLADSEGRKLSDPFSIDKNNKTDFSDSLYLTVNFTDEYKRPNKLEFYGLSQFALGNKETFKVMLNDWGVIYSENPGLKNYVILKSKDPFINSVITTALLNILKHKKDFIEKTVQHGSKATQKTAGRILPAEL